jgi:Fe-S protein assembly co-chaperone HscB
MSNYFDLFNIKPAFKIDQDSLNSIYIELQRKNHPDSQGNRKISSDLNIGYQTLKQDISRAEHILRIYNIPSESDVNISDIFEEFEEISQMTSQSLEQFILIKKRQRQNVCLELEQLCTEQNFKSFAQKLTELKYIDRILEETKKTVIKTK